MTDTEKEAHARYALAEMREAVANSDVGREDDETIMRMVWSRLLGQLAAVAEPGGAFDLMPTEIFRQIRKRQIAEEIADETRRDRLADDAMGEEL